RGRPGRAARCAGRGEGAVAVVLEVRVGRRIDALMRPVTDIPGRAVVDRSALRLADPRGPEADVPPALGASAGDRDSLAYARPTGLILGAVVAVVALYAVIFGLRCRALPGGGVAGARLVAVVGRDTGDGSALADAALADICLRAGIAVVAGHAVDRLADARL